MIHIKHILCPTDFSEHSVEAMKFACTLADKFDSALHVLHVLEVLPSATPMFGGGLAIPTHTHESRQAVDEALARLPDPTWKVGTNVVRATADGAPFVEIIRYAKDQNIDLITLGTHGRSGLAHVLLGSVAERVVRKAPCPVLTIRPGDHKFEMP